MQTNHAQKINENLKDRDSERLIKNFSPEKQCSTVFIKHSSEEGVILNGGRRGARFAPLALLNIVKKLAAHTDHILHEHEVSFPEIEVNQLEDAQTASIQKNLEILKSHKGQVIFLGGGHDHVFPDLMTIAEMHPNKKLKIINLDPHLDMRVDELKNSGTPFRQFDQKAKLAHELIQIGTLPYANVESSLLKTKTISQKIIDQEIVRNFTYNFSQNKEFLQKFIPNDFESIYFLSIDVDCLCSNDMEAVSAVNYNGLPMNFLRDLILYFKQDLNCSYYGLYEYNPVFDNLSQKGARNIASLIHDLII